MTIAQQLNALLFDYRRYAATEQDILREVARSTSAARVDQLEAALRRLDSAADRITDEAGWWDDMAGELLQAIKEATSVLDTAVNTNSKESVS